MQVRGGGEQQMKPPVHFSLTQLHHGETSKIAFIKALDKQKGDFRHISINAVFFTCSAYVGALPAFIPHLGEEPVHPHQQPSCPGDILIVTCTAITLISTRGLRKNQRSKTSLKPFRC